MGKLNLKMIADKHLRHAGVGVVHVELILNSHLIGRFECRLLEKCPHHREYAELKVVFHGIQRRYLVAIVSRGFVKPEVLIIEEIF